MGTIVSKKHLVFRPLQDRIDGMLTLAIGALTWLLALASVASIIQ
jgi:hypothetical protein